MVVIREEFNISSGVGSCVTNRQVQGILHGDKRVLFYVYNGMENMA